MATAMRKVRAVAEGAVIGGAETAAVVGGLHVGMKGLGMVAPRAAGFVARAGAAVLSWPVLVGGAVAGGAYGGVQAARRGGGTREIVLSTVGGAASLGTNIVADALFGQAQAQTAKQKPATKPTMPNPNGVLPPNFDTMSPEEQRQWLGERFGGNPKDWRLAAENERASMKSDPANAQAHARRAVALDYAADAREKELTTPPKAPKKGLLQQAHELVFGEAKPKEEDALSRERKQLESRSEELRKQMEAELGGRSGQKGIGPNYRALQKQLDDIAPKLAELTKQQQAKEHEETAAYRQLGAIVAGAAIGGVLGSMTKTAAHSAAEKAGVGVAKLARTAVQAVNSSPKSVIAGTIQGDKAAAAVSVAKDAMSKRIVSGVEAFGVPLLNIGHGAVMYTLGQTDKDNPAAPLMRMEGAGAIAAGVIGAKYGMAAYTMKAAVPHDLAGKLQAAANRLARETRSGPAGVAIARGRRLEAIAGGRAGVAQAQSRGNIAVANNRADTRAIMTGATRDVAGNVGAGRVAAARIDSKVPVVNAGSQLGVAKVRGANRVERAQIQGKASNSRAISRSNVDIKYKDTWQDNRGRIYHRKDMSVRSGRSANDNHARTTSRRARG